MNINDTGNENPVVGFIFQYGCDAPSKYEVVRRKGRCSDDYNSEKLVEKHISWDELEAIASRTNAKAIEPTWTTWCGYQFDESGWHVLWDLVAEREAAAQRIQALEEQKERERLEELLRKAKETGKPQEIASWMADCNDPKEECSLDHVTLWMMPDGTKKRHRQHTW